MNSAAEQEKSNPYAVDTRLTAGAIVLLVLLTLAGGFVLTVGIVEWVDVLDHGGGADDPELWAAVAVTVLAMVILACVAAGWFRKPRGPRVLVVVLGFVLLATLLTVNPMSILYAFVLFLLAGLLWRIAEQDW